MRPPVRYADSGSVRVAYQVTGSVPIDLVWAPGTISHLDLDWEYPAKARFIEALSAFTRLIRFDKRGTGLSDRPSVVHVNAGIAALVGALILGKRKAKAIIPGNLTLVVTGAGLLWFGWFGFNAGSRPLRRAASRARPSSIRTRLPPLRRSPGCFEWMHSGKPTVLGLASGAVGGLVAITPAAGFVNIGGSMVIGIVAGVVPFYAVAKLKPLLGYDDTLDAFGIHGIGGTLGALLTGVFADPAINEQHGVGISGHGSDSHGHRILPAFAGHLFRPGLRCGDVPEPEQYRKRHPFPGKAADRPGLLPEIPWPWRKSGGI